MRIEELLLSWKGSSDLACSGWLDPICMWRHFRTLATNAGGEPLDWRRERWQIVRVCKDIAANTLLFMVCLPRFGTIMVTRCRGIGRDSLWAARISSIVVIQIWNLLSQTQGDWKCARDLVPQTVRWKPVLDRSCQHGTGIFLFYVAQIFV